MTGAHHTFHIVWSSFREFWVNFCCCFALRSLLMVLNPVSVSCNSASVSSLPVPSPCIFPRRHHMITWPRLRGRKLSTWFTWSGGELLRTFACVSLGVFVFWKVLLPLCYFGSGDVLDPAEPLLYTFSNECLYVKRFFIAVKTKKILNIYKKRFHKRTNVWCFPSALNVLLLFIKAEIHFTLTAGTENQNNGDSWKFIRYLLLLLSIIIINVAAVYKKSNNTKDSLQKNII